MNKRICCLSSAALGVALLSACGSTNPVSLDKSKLSTGDGNQVSTGGYIWTYTDHNKTPTETPTTDEKTWNYHATITPMTDVNTPFVTTMDSDASHGSVFNVKGDVPIEIPWTLVSAQDPVSIDTFWPQYYPDATIPAYPAAGLGFGFQPNNVPYDATEGGKYVGIAFDMKANIAMELVWVSMPTEETDLPDPDNDKFTKKCQYYTATNGPAAGASSCFTNYRKGIFSATSTAGTPTAYNTMGAVGEWKRFCVLFSEFAVPSWASAAVIDLMAKPENQFNPKHALKVQWDMYQPKDGTNTTPPAHFDVSVDNISLVTSAQITENNCNPAALGSDAG